MNATSMDIIDPRSGEERQGCVASHRRLYTGSDWDSLDVGKLDNLKGQIANGNPVVVAMRLPASFFGAPGSATYDDVEAKPWVHAMVVTAYDDQRAAFRLLNSWGPNWADHGFIWVSYRAMSTMTAAAANEDNRYSRRTTMTLSCPRMFNIRSEVTSLLRGAALAMSCSFLVLIATPALAEGLSGKVLIASPSMPENAFSETVILICNDDKDGAFGLVVNRPADIPDIASKGGRKFPVRLGGPMKPRQFMLLMTDDAPPLTGLAIPGGLAVTDAMPYLNDAAAPSRRFVVMAGHSNWDPGQLETEIRGGFWLIGTADEDILFGANDETKWRRMIERRK